MLQSVKNSLTGHCDGDQSPKTNKCVRGLTGGISKLRDKLEGTGKKRYIIPLALPVGLARGFMFGALYPTMMVDRIANVIRDTREGRLVGSDKSAKIILLPIKLLIIGLAAPTGIALIPLYSIAFTISILAHCKGVLEEQSTYPQY